MMAGEGVVFAFADTCPGWSMIGEMPTGFRKKVIMREQRQAR
jgi:hypothetical protein